MDKQSPLSDNSVNFQAILKAWPGNKVYQQRQRLLLAMQARGSVTTLEAVRFLDIVDPCARIFELRAAGWKIVTGWTGQLSEAGGQHRVGVYRITTTESRLARRILVPKQSLQVMQASLFDS